MNPSSLLSRSSRLAVALGVGWFAIAGCGGDAGDRRWPPVTGALESAELSVEKAADVEAAEIVLTASAGERTLARLDVRAPSGRRLLSMFAPDTGTVGLTTIRAEVSGRETDLLAAYPQGRYVFLGETVDGARLRSEVQLDHPGTEGGS